MGFRECQGKGLGYVAILASCVERLKWETVWLLRVVRSNADGNDCMESFKIRE